MTLGSILVTGANSPLGQAVGRVLHAKGVRAVGTVRTSQLGVVLPMFDELFPLDLDESDSIPETNDTLEAIIHVASASVGSPAHLLQVTALSTARLADYAIRNGVSKFVHVSSMSIYGDVQESEVTHETPVRHTSPYGVAKWAAECYLHEVRDRLATVSIRCPAIVGRRCHRNFLAQTLQAMQENQPIIKLSNPNFYFNNVIHEDTLAGFLTDLAVKTRGGFTATPVASVEAVRLENLITLMREATNYRGLIEWVPPRTPPFTISVESARRFGFVPQTTYETFNAWLQAL